MSFLDLLLYLVTLFAALGCGLMAGLFYAFSNFVMKALARIPAPSGIAAMQAINVTVLNPLFLTIFLSTAAACGILVIYALISSQNPGSFCLLAAGLLYLVGNVVVTMAFNVPRNNALARLDASSAEAAGFWGDYVVTWTRWNHVRTVTAAVALVLLIVGLWRLRALV